MTFRSLIALIYCPNHLILFYHGGIIYLITIIEVVIERRIFLLGILFNNANVGFYQKVLIKQK